MSNGHCPIVCILNAAAGSSAVEKQRENVEKLFAEAGAEVSVFEVEDGEEIRRRVDDVLERKCERMIVGGGDGTINAVASRLIGRDTALGVLPLGTLNHFAKDLNIPLALKQAIEVAVAGRISHVDVGEVNGRVFLNNSSLGLYPGLVVQREALQRQGYGKWVAFSRALLYSLWRYRALTVRLELDDGEGAAISTPFIFVGNNRYRTCVPYLGERSRLDEGKLWVYQAPHAGRMRLFVLAMRALAGIGNAVELREQDAQEFWVYARKSHLRVATDGEVTVLETPLYYRIVPKGLAVIVPRPAAAGGQV